MNRSCFSNRHC